MEGVPDLLVRPAEDVTSSWGFPVLEKVGMGGRVDYDGGRMGGYIGGRVGGWMHWWAFGWMG